MSLAHKRILITRTRAQASELALALESLGAEPILIPTIEIIPPKTYAALDRAIAQLEIYDWLLFTSANAVEAFAKRLEAPQDRVPHLRGGLIAAKVGNVSLALKIAAIGPATARALEALGLTVTLTPPHAIAESLTESLLPHANGAKMLLIRAEQARDHLPETLQAAGANVTIVEAYRTIIPETSIQTLRDLFTTQPPDAITFTSSSTATNLFTLLREASLTLPLGIALASIGPITSQTLHDLGHPPTFEAAEANVPSLVRAIEQYFTIRP